MTLSSEPDTSINEASATKPRSPAFSKRQRIALHLVSIAFWIYTTIKLFVFDFDLYLIHQISPNFVWLTQLRFVFLLGVIGLLFLLSRTQTAISILLYILLYPFILALWKLPIFIFKQKSWTLAFAIANSLISFFQNIRRSTIKAAIFFISSALIFVSTNPYLLTGAACFLVALLLLNYITKFIAVFRRSKLVHIYTTVLNAWRESISKTNRLDEKIRNLPVSSLSSDQLKLWSSSLEAQVLFNRVCLFAARKLHNYQKSGINVISGVVTTLALFAMTILIFAIVDLGAYKANPQMFSTANAPTFFEFFYYSFKTFFVSSTKEIEAIGPLSQALAMAESFCLLLLGSIFTALMISVRSQRYSEDLDLAIAAIEDQGKVMEQNIIKEFRILTIDEALSELDRAGAGMIRVLDWFSRNMN